MLSRNKFAFKAQPNFVFKVAEGRDVRRRTNAKTAAQSDADGLKMLKVGLLLSDFWTASSLRID